MRQMDQEESTDRLYHPALMPGEQLLWRGKPQRRAFVAVNCLKMLPLAVFWLIFDLQLIEAGFQSRQLFILLFTTVHLFPVWIWLFSALTAGKRWNNTVYVLTDKRVVIRNGFWSVSEKSIYLHNVMDVSVKSTILDKPFGTGTVCFNVGQTDYRRNNSLLPSFENLENADSVYIRIQQAIALRAGEQSMYASLDSV